MNPTKKFINDIKRAGGMTDKKLRALKARVWGYPLSLERQYSASISKFLQKKWKEYAKIAVKMMVPRSDALEDLEPEPGTSGPALGAIVNIAKTISGFNKKELAAFKKIAVGEVLSEEEPWEKNVIDKWSREQVSLITKASQDMLDAVARRIRDGVKRGKSVREVTAQIYTEMPGISKRRARIIARDQTAKLNGSLSQERMSEAGIETYVWETAYDERVRGNPTGRYPRAIPSHWVMQGKICRWDDPTVYLENGEWVKRPANAPYSHPGMDILCRCVALPNWDELDELTAVDLPKVEEPPVVEKTEPQEVTNSDVGIFESEKTFKNTINSTFSKTEKFTNAWMGDAYERFRNLDENVQKCYSDTFTNYVRDIHQSKKARYQVFGNVVFVPGKFDKDEQKTASVFIHEMGHAVDSRLGKKYGMLHASARRLDKFDGKNLGEIVKEELVKSVMETAQAERADLIKDILRKITEKTRKALASVVDNPNATQYDFFKALQVADVASSLLKNVGTIHERQNELAAILYRINASRETFKAIAGGKVNVATERIVVQLLEERNKKQALKLDKYTKSFSELVKSMAESGDFEAFYGNFSDLFEGATRISGYFGIYGHGISYWSNEHFCTEAFSEILEMLASKSPKKSYILDKYLPTARDYVLETIKEAEK